MLRETGLTSLEQYQGWRKNKIIKNLLPHQFLTRSFETINGMAIECLETIDKKPAVNKRKVLEKSESNKYDLEENWHKKRSNIMPNPTAICYNRNVDLSINN